MTSRYTQKLIEMGNARNNKSTAAKVRGIKLSKQQMIVAKQLSVNEKPLELEDVFLQYPKFSKEKAAMFLDKVKQFRKQFAVLLGIDDVKGIQSPKTFGYVYLIKNEKFEGWVKCGMTTNIPKRLASYNQNDPTRGFCVIIQQSVSNRHHTEKLLINRLMMASKTSNGEWFKIDEQKAVEIFRSI